MELQNEIDGVSKSEGRLNVTHEGWEGEEMKSQEKVDGSLEEQNTVETI